jgi:pimeloyl-ACP methyl ester carboxylesterase
VIGLLKLFPVALVFAIFAALIVPIAVGVKLGVAIARGLRRSFGKKPTLHTSTVVTSADLESRAPMVFLIHGTFAAGAPWTQSDASIATTLSMELLNEFGERPLIHRLAWSGENSVAARARAITELTTSLEQVFRFNANRQVILIGHSHGGNIAMKAAEAFASYPNLGIVTMATPFLVAQYRPFPLLFQLLIPLLAVVGAGSMLLVAYVAAHALSIDATVIYVAGALLALLVVAMLVRRLRSRESVTFAADALFATMVDPSKVAALADRSLIVSRAGDEADGLLKLSSLLANWIATTVRSSDMSRQLIRLFESLLSQSTIAEADKRAVLNALFRGEPLPALPLANSQMSVLGPALMSPSTLSQFFALIGSSQRSVPDAIAVSIGLMMLSAVRFAVGTESGVIATQVLVTSSETPPGRWQHLQTQASNDAVDSLLSHSQIYTDPTVVGSIVAWCTARFASGTDHEVLTHR